MNSSLLLKKLSVIACVAFVMMLLNTPAQAATKTWNNAASTNWFTAGNWLASGVPASGDTVIVNLGSTGPIVNATGATVTTIEVGTTATGGTIGVSAGGVLTDTNGYLGYATGSGTSTVTGTGAKWSNTTGFYVGYGSTGTLNVQSGGLVSDTTGYIGYTAGKTGTATVNGSNSGWTNSGNLNVGQNGTGTLNIQNSAIVSDVNGYLGNLAGSSGTSTVTGSGSKWTNTTGFYVGNSGSGTLNIQSGGLVSDTTGYIGYAASQTGTATIDGSGSSWTNSGNLSVGQSGTGTLNIQNSAVVSDVNGYLGNVAGGSGTGTVTGAGSKWTNTTGVYVGNSGSGTLNIQSGGVVSDATGYIGYAASQTGSATVDGSGSAWTNSLNFYVGNSGTGTLNIQNGGTVTDTNVNATIANNSGSTGTVTVTGMGSSWSGNPFLTVGRAGTGTLNITNNGTVSSTANFTVSNLSTSQGTLNINSGGTLNAGEGYLGAGTGSHGTATISGSGSSWLSAGVVSVGDNGTGTLNIINSGAMTDLTGFVAKNKNSVGTVTLDGSGSSWTNTADLYIGRSGTGTVTISNGATLSTASGQTYNYYDDAPSPATTTTRTGSSTIYLATNTGSTGTLNIGAASGSTAVAPGTLTANTIAFGSGTGKINFNHTSNNYIFAPVISGNGTLNVLAGTTVLTGNDNGFTGKTTIDTGGTLTLQNNLSNSQIVVGNTGTGIFNIQNSGVLSDTTGYIANASTATGTANVTGAGANWSNSGTLYVGNNGSGTLNVSAGGAVSAKNAYVGNNTGSSGYATITGAGSVWNNSGNFYVGGGHSSGVLDVQNSAVVSTLGYMWVGTNNTAALTVESGGSVSDTQGHIGVASGSVASATVTGTNSSWSNSQYFLVGNGGTGTLNILNGGNVVSTGVTGTGYAGLENVGGVIGNYGGATGTALVDGIGSTWNDAGVLLVGGGNDGNAGHGTLTVQNGGRVTDTTGYIGHNASSTGIMTVTGAGSVWSNNGDLYIGENSGFGILTLANQGAATTASNISYNHNGSVKTSSGAVYLADTSGSVGTLNIGAAPGNAAVSPGTLTATTVNFGSGTGVINFNHTASNYIFTPNITGNGALNALSGTTIFSGNLSGFTGTTNLLGGGFGYSYGNGSTISSQFTGGGAITIASGGTTYLASNSSAFTGTTTINNGSILSVNGELGGTVDVTSGATLKGHGSAGTVITSAGSILAPGNSIGTLTVSSITINPGTVYQAEVNSAGASDLIHSTGTATINGGTVSILPASGFYTPGIKYDILKADGGITGAFSNTTLNMNSLFLSPMLTYDANNVYASIARNNVSFASVATTPNQHSVATALESAGTGNLAFNAISQQSSASGAQTAYNSLSGEAHASMQSALLAEQQGLSEIAITRLRSLSSEQAASIAPVQLAYAGDELSGLLSAKAKTGVWTQAFGNWQRYGDNGNAAGLRDNTGGVLIGADGSLGADWRSGAAIGYSNSNLSVSGRSSASQSNNYHATLYGGRDLPITGERSLVLNLAGSFSWSAVSSTRSVSFVDFNDTNQANYNAHTSQAFAELAYPMPLGRNHIEPYADISYLHQSTDGYTENGGAAALTIARSSSDLLPATLGLRIRHDAVFGSDSNKKVSLSGSLGWKHTEGDLTPQTTAAFASGSSSFTVNGTPLAKDAAAYETGISMELATDASIGLYYGGQLADNAQSQSLTGKLRYQF